MNIIVYLPLCLLSLLIAFSSCHSGHDHEADDHDHTAEAGAEAHEHAPDEILFTDEQAKRAGLQVAEVQPSDFAEVIEVSGRILPAQGAEATVSATMAGIVRPVSSALVDGAAVSGGQSLFVISARSMADGNPAAAAQAELEVAKLALERTEKLAAQHIISVRELEEARSRHTAALAAARSLGGSAQTRSVASPLSGTLKNILVKSGDYVTAGQPLATVTQNKRLQLRADVPERHYAFLSRIRTARFRMSDASAGQTWSMEELGGRLLAKGNSAQAEDFFVPVTFEFNNRGNLVPGSFVQVWLQGNSRSGVLSVPVEAVTEAQGLHFVYVRLHPGSYRRQEVRLGATDGQRVEILQGLQPGDTVVTRGAVQVRLAANASVVPEGHKH